MKNSTNQDRTHTRKLAVCGGIASALAILTLPVSAATITLTVPGVADVWLAGQPNGSTLGDDKSPTNGPVMSSGGSTLTAGGVLTFSATGRTSLFGNVGGSGGAPSPDGTLGFGTIPANSLSGFTGPADALIGVFVGSGVPTGSAPMGLDFTTMAQQSAGMVSPLLQQVFFIGDGLTGTGTGSSQQFTIPNGERLFLGSSDTVGNNFNNSGSFTVTVSDNVPTSGTPEPDTVLLVLIPSALLLMLRSVCKSRTVGREDR